MNNLLFAELFGGKSRLKVLRCLFEHNDQAFGLRELAMQSQTDSGNLTRLLNRWEKAGLINVIPGRVRRYQASPDPSLMILKKLLTQTSEMTNDLKSFFLNEHEVDVAFVFGSVAKAKEIADSDVDILVIGDISELKLNAKLKSFERKYNRPFNASVYSQAEFKRPFDNNDSFIIRICEDEKIMIKGDVPCHH